MWCKKSIKMTGRKKDIKTSRVKTTRSKYSQNAVIRSDATEDVSLRYEML